MAKEKWAEHHAEIVHNMRFNPKDAWKAIRVLSDNNFSHYKKPKSAVSFKRSDGTYTKTDEEHMKEARPQF